MPFITFKNTKKEVVIKASDKLEELLAMSMSVPEERLRFEFSESTYYNKGSLNEDICIINVKMIDKGEQVRQVVSTILDEYIKAETGQKTTIFFEHVDKKLYFIEGTRFDK